MTVRIATEAEVRQEVAQLLLQYLTPAKLARFWASWQIGQGDYLDWRDEAFAQETVASLYEKILSFQEETPQTN
ncbi:MAG TPA: hypothetical protein VEC93_23265 [Anaerolineae bacterium]|nr:hypothetical protein [Anaerolineae bacterium]